MAGRRRAHGRPEQRARSEATRARSRRAADSATRGRPCVRGHPSRAQDNRHPTRPAGSGGRDRRRGGQRHLVHGIPRRLRLDRPAGVRVRRLSRALPRGHRGRARAVLRRPSLPLFAGILDGRWCRTRCRIHRSTYRRYPAMSGRTIRDCPSARPRWASSTGTSAVKLAWGTWRLSICRVPPSDLDLTRRYDRASTRWSLISAILGYSRAYPELFAQLRRDGWLDQCTSAGCVLDCGTGTGALVRALSVNLARPLCLHGVDRSPGMLARAAIELGRGPSPVELRRADIRRLPFPSGGFEVVMSAHILEHLSDPLDGLREMVRVLRPGGTLLLVTTRPSVPEAVLRLTWRYRTFNQAWLLHALTACGLPRSRCYQVGRRPRTARWLSLAYVARKSGETDSTTPGALGIAS